MKPKIYLKHPPNFLTRKEGRKKGRREREREKKRIKRKDFPGGPVVGTSPSNVGGAGSSPGWGARIPHTSRPKDQNIKQKQYCNKFNKDF